MLTEDQQAHLLGAAVLAVPRPYRVIGETAVWVYAMTYGKGRLCIGQADNAMSYDRGFCYESLPAAFASADKWDGTGEPEGWFKNLQTGRYRKNGDPAKEYGPDDIEIPA